MDEGIERARAEGRELAEAADRDLRTSERIECETRLAAATAADRSAATHRNVPLDAIRLQTQMKELLAFRRAVQGSRVWRTAQAVRRVLGRAW